MIQGNLTWATDKDIHIVLQFDKIALDAGDRLMFLSAIGYPQNAKAFRAGLASRLKDPIVLKVPENTSGITIYGGSKHRYACACTCYIAGYHTEIWKLGRDMVHATFTAKRRGLLMNGSDEALWQELKHERFETPLLRGWVPYIKQQLLASGGLLEPCWGIDCELWELICTTKDLDEIVVRGVTSGELKISQEAA